MERWSVRLLHCACWSLCVTYSSTRICKSAHTSTAHCTVFSLARRSKIARTPSASPRCSIVSPTYNPPTSFTARGPTCAFLAGVRKGYRSAASVHPRPDRVRGTRFTQCCLRSDANQHNRLSQAVDEDSTSDDVGDEENDEPVRCESYLCRHSALSLPSLCSCFGARRQPKGRRCAILSKHGCLCFHPER
jgi:hypothetical protein